MSANTFGFEQSSNLLLTLCICLLWTSYKWNCIICSFLCLASFIQHFSHILLLLCTIHCSYMHFTPPSTSPQTSTSKIFIIIVFLFFILKNSLSPISCCPFAHLLEHCQPGKWTILTFSNSQQFVSFEQCLQSSTPTHAGILIGLIIAILS